MNHTYFKQFRGEPQRSHQRKTSNFVQRIIKRNKKTGVFIAICYVNHNAIQQITRTKGGIFKVIAERLGKQYKFFVFPSVEKERIEIYFRGAMMQKVEMDIHSSANVTFEQMINMKSEGFLRNPTFEEQMTVQQMDPKVKELLSKIKK